MTYILQLVLGRIPPNSEVGRRFLEDLDCVVAGMSESKGKITIVLLITALAILSVGQTAIFGPIYLMIDHLEKE